MTGRILEIVTALSVLAALPACGNHCADHKVGEYSCEGNTLVGCYMDDTGDLSTEISCGSQFCRSPTPGQAFCAVRPDPDPACPASGTRTVCEADGHVADCSGGYIQKEYWGCGAPDLCISDRTYNPFCALSSQPDPHCPQPPAGSTADAFQFVCGDAGHLVGCQNGYAVSDKDCGGADLCHAPQPAMPATFDNEPICIVSGSPDPRCAAFITPPFQGADIHKKTGCDGTLLLFCTDDFLDETSDCGAKGCVATAGFASCGQ